MTQFLYIHVLADSNEAASKSRPATNTDRDIKDIDKKMNDLGFGELFDMTLQNKNGNGIKTNVQRKSPPAICPWNTVML